MVYLAKNSQRKVTVLVVRCIYPNSTSANMATTHINLVLLAGTNDLSNYSVSPEDLIDKLDEYISELKGFSNLGYIFLCQIPNRFDF